MTETAGRQIDDVTFDQMQQLVGLVEHDASKDPFPVRALDAVVFVVGSATQSALLRGGALPARSRAVDLLSRMA